MTTEKKTFSLKEAFRELSDSLIEQNPIEIGSLWEFIRDIWAESYPTPELLRLWHVQYMCEKAEEAFNKGKNFLGILPRGHYKSTALGHGFSMWRLLKYPRDVSLLYLSYNDDMARYHVQQIKTAIRNNEKLQKWLPKDLAKNTESVIRYLTSDNRIIRIESSGLFVFKRGMHVDGGMVADDVLKDPTSPVNLGELPKIEEIFMKESMPIPNPGAPIMVVGTPMAPGDLLSNLQTDERFESVVLPALDPVEGRKVLAPEIRSEEWLMAYKNSQPTAFATEYALVPHYGSDGYFSEEELIKCENPDLDNLRSGISHVGYVHDFEYVVAGFDIGKRRHPSHLVVFGKVKDGPLVQLHQAFLDKWAYVDQVAYANTIAENFDIDIGYVDNTRGELEEVLSRDEGENIDKRWQLLSFTRKKKNEMAQAFEKRVMSAQEYEDGKGPFQMLKDTRQREQVLLVTKDLQALETPRGHGDSFWSIALAMLAASESEFGPTFQDIGDLGKLTMIEAPKRGETGLEGLQSGQNQSEENPLPNCPKCGNKGYIVERPLCLICNYRGETLEEIV